MSNPVVVVVGAGPGVSGSVARRFGREGYDVALVGNDEQAVTALGEELQAAGVTAGWTIADITDPGLVSAAIKRFGDHTGRIDVLHFNPSAFRAKGPLELTPAELAEDVGVGVGALLTALQAAHPFMMAGARVTATGSMAADEPSPGATSLGVQKAALRNLVHSIDKALADQGIRAVSVTVRGVLAREGAFTPDRVADAIFAAANQQESDWRSEVPYSG
jgi:NAD(P)-dependent dehydrogenase (short-subunit alcohol dehydrogenase family)